MSYQTLEPRQMLAAIEFIEPAAPDFSSVNVVLDSWDAGGESFAFAPNHDTNFIWRMNDFESQPEKVEILSQDAFFEHDSFSGLGELAYFLNALIEGNRIGTDATGEVAFPNRNGIQLRSQGNTLNNNVISGNLRDGIAIFDFDATDNLIFGNLIGVSISSNTLGNGNNGIFAVADRQAIGLANYVSPNIIGGNGRVGIHLRSVSDAQVVDNLVGVNSSDQLVPNEIGGVRVIGSPNLTLESNVVSGNGGTGVFIGGLATSFVARGNYIGTATDGNGDLGNAGYGLAINNGRDGFVQQNIIAGNEGGGVYMTGGKTRHRVVNNTFGAGVDGVSPIPNGGFGFLIISSENMIGSPSEPNLFFDDQRPLVIRNGDRNRIRGNQFGSAEDAFSELNPLHAAFIIGDAEQNEFVDNHFEWGRTAIRNRSSANGNQFLGNRFETKVVTAIDNGLFGIDANDLGDTDEGTNRGQNSPVLESAIVSGELLTLEYFVDTSTLNGTYPLRVEFYIQRDSGTVQRFLLGVDQFTETEYLNSTNKTFELAVAQFEFMEGDSIMATATDGEGNTSELGQAILVQL